MAQSDIGLIGLAVMGQNLALNIADHGFRISVYNRSPERTTEFLHGPAANHPQVVGTTEIGEFVASLQRPRKMVLMIRAGAAVDATIAQLLPHLDKGDILMDGGNSRYLDSNRRYAALREAGILFVGSGVSGGEEGARHGPSIMPGGDPRAWPLLQPILQKIAAQVDGVPCCHWVGEAGSGHYVKMVHNGIEYGDMQLIAEAYHLMRRGLNLSVEQIREIFIQWNKGVLDSYLIAITADILGVKEPDGTALLDKILDSAGQKGTGKWTGISSMELGVPLTLIGEAVYARCLSARKAERVKAEALYGKPHPRFDGDAERVVAALHDALYAAKIISYAQGYMLMRDAAEAFDWNLNYGDIALMWRGGCIIRSRFLNDIKAAYLHDPALESLLLAPFFHQALTAAEPSWRRTVELAIGLGVPVPALSSALSFFDGYRSGQLPANLIQAQRDYFGAHTYERIDHPRGSFFHSDWVGSGGHAAAGNYSV